MRADLALLLAALVVATPGGARADGTIPEVPEPSCQCGPNGEWILCSRCHGDDSSAGTSGTGQRTQGVPPILKLAAGAVVVTVVAGMFVVAPGHTASLFTSSKSARQAREAWRDERARISDLEAAGTEAVVLGRALDRHVAAAGRPVRAQVGPGYAPVAPAAPPAAWAPHGACSELVEANQRALENLDRRASAEARAQFPTWASVVAQAKGAALTQVARAVGAGKLLAQGKALQGDLARAKEMEAFLAELVACQDRKAVDPATDCEQVIYARVNAELKVFLDELQAGAGEAHERVRKASQFYGGYVNDLRREVEKQALWATRCR